MSIDDEKDLKITDFSAPTESAPGTIKEMIERRRELSAGRAIASVHRYARYIAPGFRSKIMTILEANNDDASFIGKALSFTREKVGGYKQVLTDSELRRMRTVYEKTMGVFADDMPPNEALTVVTECFTFIKELLEKYSDRMGVHAIHEIEILADLAGLARARHGFWEESAGYVMPYELWMKLGCPAVNSSVPFDAAKVSASKENRQVTSNPETNSGLKITEEEVLKSMPKIETPSFRGDYFDLNGKKTIGGSGGEGMKP